ncbi:hypothetical protein [Candidatus Venteria ishoeyi]|uniref:Lipoprotein n=1 Tax=Candidatus Venteria ishoeyi TaxID=1899563 RepID=A0A1H6FF53_9GAMM|nr:hypothetical protein [Candidatus Venteria ishoeyi]MDM8545607.1 hypothetical protein [Candidatus Venteria ishoeyi]SEH07665.1 Uncharacterised protein [Candidatus Venteria ishoeyi]
MNKYWIVLSLLSLLLTACGPTYKTDVQYIPPGDVRGKNCALDCQEQKSSCQYSCDRAYDDCMEKARMQAKINYLEAQEDYLQRKEQCLDHAEHWQDAKDCRKRSAPVQSSYMHSYQCDKNCNCTVDFESCFQICGGQVLKTTRCVSGCEENK